MSNVEQLRICVVDDEAAVRRSLARLLRTRYDQVDEFESPTDLLQSEQVNAADCLILDYYLPNMTGPEVLEALESRGIELPTIMISGLQRESWPKMASDVTFVKKPLKASVLFDAIRSTVSREVA